MIANIAGLGIWIFTFYLNGIDFSDRYTETVFSGSC